MSLSSFAYHMDRKSGASHLDIIFKYKEMWSYRIVKNTIYLSYVWRLRLTLLEDFGQFTSLNLLYTQNLEYLDIN